MNICVISNGYPSPGRPVFPFVEQLCNEWAKQGHKITVIVPHSRTKRLVRKLRKVEYKRLTFSNKGSVTVYSPEYWSFGKYGIMGVNQNLFVRAVNNVAKHLCKPDFVYCHFWHNGRAAYDLAKRWNVPLVVASGESVITQRIRTRKDRAFADYVNAVVCVSTKNMDESVKKGLTTADKCGVFPNAIDVGLFYKQDKGKCKEILGISKDDFIVCFVGGFVIRKGPNRVSQAIKLLNNPNIKSIFIGGRLDSSFVKPDCDGIIYQGMLPHEDIPLYLNASDVFVLPTLQEGCCNAIVEAMSCGLPIISSDLPFNKDILNGNNSIMVDPMNISQLADAINTIYSDKDLRKKMSVMSLQMATKLSISQRAHAILNFVGERNQSVGK